MQLCEVLGFHSGVNKLRFLLLYEVILLGNWLQSFGEKERVSFSKRQNV
jgi:hypothetical protein